MKKLAVLATLSLIVIGLSFGFLENSRPCLAFTMPHPPLVGALLATAHPCGADEPLWAGFSLESVS